MFSSELFGMYNIVCFCIKNDVISFTMRNIYYDCHGFMCKYIHYISQKFDPVIILLTVG